MASTSSSCNTAECPICYESFKVPKVLTCGHTFCLDCIDRYIGGKVIQFLCPVCGDKIKIPKGGARMFITNYVVHTDPTTPTQIRPTDISNVPVPITKHKCPNHIQREVDYYCNKCLVGLCSKCIYKHHNSHEVLDVESETTKTKAIEILQHSEKFIRNKLNELERTHATLLATSKKLKALYENSCGTITKEIEEIIADLKNYCRKSKVDIKHNYDENELLLEGKRDEVKTQIKSLKLGLDANLPSHADDPCLTLLECVPKIKDLENQCESLRVELPDITYMEWKRNYDEGVNISGNLHSKTYYIPNLNCYIFEVNESWGIDKDYHNAMKITDNRIVWSCVAKRFFDGYLGIFIYLLDSDNPAIQSCDVDFKLTLVNTANEIMSIQKFYRHEFSKPVDHWGSTHFISSADLTDTQQGFINENNEFIIQFDIIKVNNIQMVN